jgi:rhamnogalacturonyl hydrolase YesR
MTATGGATGAGGSAAGGSAGSCPVISDFQTWPAGKGPADIGKLAVTDFKGHTGDVYGGAGYALAFSWFGALRFSKLTGDTANNQTLITAFEPYATGSITVDNSATATVDSRAFGDLPLEIYQQNADPRCKTLGLARADMQWASTSANGITSDARYWADDMYMITGLQVEAYRVTKDTKYLDRMTKTMLAYFTALQQPGGLFWHTMTSKAYWGRANGWVAAGMAELLLELPAGATRDMIMTGFKAEMDGLLPLQVNGGTDDGMWRQVLDLASAPAESSCTAMFTFALTTAVKNGWLTDPKYSAAARKGWLAVANKTNSAGKLDKICPGTGAAPAGTLASQQQFYATIALGLGDLHGQAPLMWAAHALLRNDCPGVR